jgi:hypothetical protein
MFNSALELETGEIVDRDGFVFADFTVASGAAVSQSR